MVNATMRPDDEDLTGGHPSPRMRRDCWFDLGGPWGFAHDDANEGLDARWFERDVDQRTIIVPFPPESPASMVADNGFHPVIWYSRRFGSVELLRSGLHAQGERALLHFGAVDYTATVWLNGLLLGTHVGGHTPFTFDITTAVHEQGDNLLVLRAEDRADDVAQPRGKQAWTEQARAIWYDRTSGIWQPVWLEAVPSNYVRRLDWLPNRDTDAVRMELEVAHPLKSGGTVQVALSVDGETLTTHTASVDPSGSVVLTLDLRQQLNGQQYDELLWSPERPTLIDATVSLELDQGYDEVLSYLGLRTVGIRAGQFLLNDRPCFLRAVLEQGFWPDTHLASPSDLALRDEVALIKRLGFNAARLHQKFESPRFLYWADRLGLMLWAEAPATYEFTPAAISRLTTEWIDVVRRDRSHPSVVTWVPLNESWGVQHIATDPAQRAFSRSIADLTRALDPSRPVISNDGWEHTDSDILSVHDYDEDTHAVRARYADANAIIRLFESYGPAGRLMMAEGSPDLRKPVMVTEFGGVRYAPDREDTTWGYQTATTPQEFEDQVRGTFEALLASPVLAGFCYTQLTDTMQESNGLLDEHRRPKFPIEAIRAIVTGRAEPHQAIA